MLNSRTAILICFLLLSAYVTNLLIERESESVLPPDITKNDPDLYMLKATITQFTELGSTKHRISAERFTHFPLTDITTLKQPTIQLFPDDINPSPWDIVADNGRLLPKVAIREESVELWDDVRANRQNPAGDFIQITTSSLAIYPDADFAETNQRVEINDRNGQTIAAGMRAYLGDGRFEFSSAPGLRVQTTILPPTATQEAD